MIIFCPPHLCAHAGKPRYRTGTSPANGFAMRGKKAGVGFSY